MSTLFLRNYLYLDTAGIDSLYYQLPNPKPNIERTSTKILSGELSGGVELGAGLKYIVSGQAKSSLGVENEITDKFEKTVRTENKVATLIKEICNDEIPRITDIIAEKPLFSTKLVVCKSIFRFVKAINEDNHLPLLPDEILTAHSGFVNILRIIMLIIASHRSRTNESLGSATGGDIRNDISWSAFFSS